MTQEYIITEEELAGMIYYFYNGFFSDGSDIASKVRSRLYTAVSERVKMLDELIQWRTAYKVKNGYFPRQGAIWDRVEELSRGES